MKMNIKMHKAVPRMRVRGEERLIDRTGPIVFVFGCPQLKGWKLDSRHLLAFVDSIVIRDRSMAAEKTVIRVWKKKPNPWIRRRKGTRECWRCIRLTCHISRGIPRNISRRSFKIPLLHEKGLALAWRSKAWHACVRSVTSMFTDQNSYYGCIESWFGDLQWWRLQMTKMTLTRSSRAMNIDPRRIIVYHNPLRALITYIYTSQPSVLRLPTPPVHSLVDRSLAVSTILS